MRFVELEEATAPLREYAEGAGREPLVVLTAGRPTAILLPIENADLETVSLSGNPEFMAIIERSRARHEQEGGIPAAEMRRLGLE